MQPFISVIMSTYNTPKEWLDDAINSVLEQTYSNFEFIIVDDCSDEEFRPECDIYNDSRIVWIRNEENMGLTRSLNKALKLAKGEFIARMDSDDISLPYRFATQIEYMQSHPDVIVCGSWRQAFGNESKNEIWNLPKTREEQQVQLFFYNCGLTHPTAMFRKSMLDKYGISYNESYHKAQDYGIWVQCTRYAPMEMIPQVLLKYRKSEMQISTAGKSSQIENANRVKTDQLMALGIDASDKEKLLHIALVMNDTSVNPNALRLWVDLLLDANRQTEYFNVKCFEKELKHRWFKWCKKAYKEDGIIEAKKFYKEANTFEYMVSDVILLLKQKIAKIIKK